MFDYRKGNSNLTGLSDIIIETTRQCMLRLIENDVLPRRSQLRKMDTIDVSSWAKDFMEEKDTTSMPAMRLDENEREILNQNWCLCVPPILDGVVLMNKDRYIMFEVKEIRLDEKEYDVELIDLSYDEGVWMFAGCVVATITELSKEKQFLYQYVSLYELLDGTFIRRTAPYSIKLDKDLERSLKTIALPYYKECDEDDAKTRTPEPVSLLNHFFTAITRVNIELMSGPRPKAVRNGNKLKVKTVTDKVPEKNPKPQIVRTLSSGVQIKSVSVPKAPTVEIIRHYKVASWNVRGHIRHYKNGKTIYIAPTVAKRKEFENAEAAKKQTIIVSGNKIKRSIERKEENNEHTDR